MNFDYIEKCAPLNLMPALAVLKSKSDETKSNVFTIGSQWEKEVEALSKCKFSFVEKNADGDQIQDFEDNLLQYSKNGDDTLIIKFSDYLPR